MCLVGLPLPHPGTECRTVSLKQRTQFYSNVGLPVVQLIGMCTGKVDKKDHAFLGLFL